MHKRYFIHHSLQILHSFCFTFEFLLIVQHLLISTFFSLITLYYILFHTNSNVFLQEKQWFWSDGTRFDYTIWANGEPNNGEGQQHCIQMNFGGKRTQCFLQVLSHYIHFILVLVLFSRFDKFDWFVFNSLTPLLVCVLADAKAWDDVQCWTKLPSICAK